MRKLLTLLFTFSGLTVATLGHAADGVVDLTWGTTCTPLVQNITPTSTNIPPNSLIASVIGNDQTHSGYQVVFLVGSASRTVPDAWEFDAGGCQGESFIVINHIPPGSAVKTCPAFNGAVSTLQIKEFKKVTDVGSVYPDRYKGLLANAYTNGNTTVASQRYFLAQFLFDHTFSVDAPTTPGADCGEFDTPMCFALLTGPRHVQYEGASTIYTSLADGVEHEFGAGTSSWLTTHSLGGCPTVPALNTTWGQIKSQYRN